MSHKKLSILVIKNISPGQWLMFPPANKMVKPRENVDILKLCGGNTDTALQVVKSYRNHPSWQVFEVFEKPLAPEGEIENKVGPSISPEPREAPPEPKEVARPKAEEKVKVFPKKKVEQSGPTPDSAA
jgi:hypothetical protein